MRKILPVAFAFLFPALLMAQSTGFQSPTATAAPNGGWANPTGAFTSDDVYTTVPHQSGCRCPFVYLSWDNGTTFTSFQIVGPFGTTDNTLTAGSPGDTWGHAWTPAETANGSFVLKIANPSTLIEQGYTDFNLNVPSTAVITGIEVNVEQHGDSGFTTEYVDVIQVNVHYTLSSGITGIAGTNINVYPNPATSLLTIENLQGTSSLRLYDMTGRTAAEAVSVSSNRHTFDVEDLPAGMYLLEIREESGMVLTRKIMIE